MNRLGCLVLGCGRNLGCLYLLDLCLVCVDNRRSFNRCRLGYLDRRSGLYSRFFFFLDRLGFCFLNRCRLGLYFLNRRSRCCLLNGSCLRSGSRCRLCSRGIERLTDNDIVGYWSSLHNVALHFGNGEAAETIDEVEEVSDRVEIFLSSEMSDRSNTVHTRSVAVVHRLGSGYSGVNKGHFTCIRVYHDEIRREHNVLERKIAVHSSLVYLNDLCNYREKLFLGYDLFQEAAERNSLSADEDELACVLDRGLHKAFYEIL